MTHPNAMHERFAVSDDHCAGYRKWVAGIIAATHLVDTTGWDTNTLYTWICNSTPGDVGEYRRLLEYRDQLRRCANHDCSCRVSQIELIVELIPMYADFQTAVREIRDHDGRIVHLPGEIASGPWNGFIEYRDDYDLIDVSFDGVRGTITTTVTDGPTRTFELLRPDDAQVRAYEVLEAIEQLPRAGAAWRLVEHAVNADQLTAAVLAGRRLNIGRYRLVDELIADTHDIVDELRSIDEALALDLFANCDLAVEDVLATVRRLA